MRFSGTTERKESACQISGLSDLEQPVQENRSSQMGSGRDAGVPGSPLKSIRVPALPADNGSQPRHWGAMHLAEAQLLLWDDVTPDVSCQS
jgi:hypothetical protein